MVTRVEFADFLDRLADNRTSQIEWQHFIVNHYHDEFLEEMRRCTARLMLNKLPYHGTTEPGREALRCWAMAIRSSCNHLEEDGSLTTDAAVILAIDRNEAAVIDEILRRFSTTDQLTIEHPAEKQALWNLECVFEKLDDRPRWPSLKEARAALLPQDE